MSDRRPVSSDVETESPEAERPTCPHCESGRTAPTAYGFPGPELAAAGWRGEVYLAGCCVTGDDPPWGCFDCQAGFWDDDRYRVYRHRMEVDGLTVRGGGRRTGRVEWLSGGSLWIVGLDGVLLFPPPLEWADAFIRSRVPGGEAAAGEAADDRDGDWMDEPWGRRPPDLGLMRAAAAWLETSGRVTPMATELRTANVPHVFEPRAPLV